jgi:hypothetical protein
VAESHTVLTDRLYHEVVERPPVIALGDAVRDVRTICCRSAIDWHEWGRVHSFSGGLIVMVPPMVVVIFLFLSG